MNILILGGTGFIGPHVARHLAASGHAVTLYNRGQSTTQLPAGITQIIGDRAAIGEAASRFRALRPDVVLDMRALVESDARRVVETMTGIAPRLVTISSIDVYRAFARFIGTEPGEPDAVPFDENGPLRDKRFPIASTRRLPQAILAPGRMTMTRSRSRNSYLVRVESPALSSACQWSTATTTISTGFCHTSSDSPISGR